jgi:hypothetical protein
VLPSNRWLQLHCLMWAAAFPFRILPLYVVAVFGFEAVFLAHLFTASRREFVARHGLWLCLQQTEWGWSRWTRWHWRHRRHWRLGGTMTTYHLGLLCLQQTVWGWWSRWKRHWRNRRPRRTRGMRHWRNRRPRRLGGMRHWRPRGMRTTCHLRLLLAYTCMQHITK